MADIIQPDEVVTDQNEPTALEPNDQINALQNAMWNDAPLPAQPAATNEPAVTQPASTEQPKQDENVFDEVDYLKRNFEVESIDVLKAEREELKKLRDQKPEIKFENEFSDKLFKAIQAGKVKEVTKLLREQDELEEIISAEVTKDNAEAFIKMNMRLKNPNLSKSEIDFEYEEQYIQPKKPKEPVQRTSETDEEFEERKNDYNEALSEWNRMVEKIETRKSIAAKMAKPELEAAKAKIVFPDLGQENQQPKPTQEELDNFRKQQDSFVQSAESVLKNFNGFSVQVKDKDVDYSVSYAPSQEEKAAVSKIVNQFASSGFNANALFAERWVNPDNTLNENQITKDVLRILAGEKAEAKIANDAAGQRLELYLKGKKNIQVDGTPSGTFNPNQQTESERLQAQFWG